MYSTPWMKLPEEVVHVIRWSLGTRSVGLFTDLNSPQQSTPEVRKLSSAFESLDLAVLDIDEQTGLGVGKHH